MTSSRRQFLKKALWATGGLVAAAGGTGFYSYGIEPHLIRQKNYDLTSAKWPQGYKPLKIAAAGDLHVGCPSIDLAALDGVVDRLNAVSADIIVLLGDFLIGGVLGGTYQGPQSIAERLARLKAPLGVYAVLGNHDWWKDGEGMWTALEQVGIKVLENNAVRVAHTGGDFWVAGLADDTSRKPNLARTMSFVTDEAPVVMLSHDPATFLEMSDRPVVTMCGHTHGGQVAMPFFGPLVIPGRAPMKYAYGHIVENARDLIVTSGLGTSILPIRFNRRPEIMQITINAA